MNDVSSRSGHPARGRRGLAVCVVTGLIVLALAAVVQRRDLWHAFQRLRLHHGSLSTQRDAIVHLAGCLERRDLAPVLGALEEEAASIPFDDAGCEAVVLPEGLFLDGAFLGALAEILVKDESAVEAVLSERSAVRRLCGVRALWEPGRFGPSASRHLWRCVEDESPSVRSDALYGLYECHVTKLADENVRALMRIVEADPCATIRLNAAYVLAKTDCREEVLRCFVSRLEDESEDGLLRRVAIDALGECCPLDPAAQSALREIAATEDGDVIAADMAAAVLEKCAAAGRRER